MNLENKLDNKCFWHEIAQEEKKLNDMPAVIHSYKKFGCYKCDGYQKNCVFYKYVTPEVNYEGI